MNGIRPLSFTWDGESMVPLAPKLADQQYVVGEKYRLAPYEERSQGSHAHYFACLSAAHKSLPDEYADKYPTVEHLRKWALIKTGYRTEQAIACASAEEAERVAAFVKPIDDYAVVLVHECIVTVYTAKSQSVHSMSKEEFQQSKEAVLDVLSRILKTDVTSIRKAADAA